MFPGYPMDHRLLFFGELQLNRQSRAGHLILLGAGMVVLLRAGSRRHTMAIDVECLAKLDSVRAAGNGWMPV
jgi:hypothetical protein